MSQQDVMDILKEYDEPLSTKTIHRLLKKKGINIGIGSVQSNCRKLLRTGFIIKLYAKDNMKFSKIILKEKYEKYLEEIKNGEKRTN